MPDEVNGQVDSSLPFLFPAMIAAGEDDAGRFVAEWGQGEGCEINKQIRRQWRWESSSLLAVVVADS